MFYRVGDIISCINLKEWLSLRKELENRGYTLLFLPHMHIKIVGTPWAEPGGK